MRRLLSRFVGGAAVIGCGVCVASGCVENETMVFIQGVMLTEPPDCSVTAEANAGLLGEGTLDIALSREYRAWLLVGNQMAARGVKTELRAESSRVTFEGAEILLTDSENRELGNYSVPAGGFAHVNRSDDSAFGAVLATLMPGQVGQDVGADVAPGTFRTVVANVRVFGRTLGGRAVDSSEFTFPIRVCNTCLVMPDYFTRSPQGRCVVPPDADLVRGCFPGQDAGHTCAFCLEQDCGL